LPTLLEVAGFVFYMVMFDCREPRPVHVSRGGDRRASAKFWIDPVRLESAGRYNDHDLARMARLIVEHQALLVRRWDEECERAKEAGR
jgi:hypothetical protein